MAMCACCTRCRRYLVYCMAVWCACLALQQEVKSGLLRAERML